MMFENAKTPTNKFLIIPEAPESAESESSVSLDLKPIEGLKLNSNSTGL